MTSYGLYFKEKEIISREAVFRGELVGAGEAGNGSSEARAERAPRA